MSEGPASVDPLLKADGTPFKIAVLIPTINNADELDIVLERLSKANLQRFRNHHRRFQIERPHQAGVRKVWRNMD